jgi:ABC-type transport system involved in cytochrome bd biosynthesis fused ATPase/permease subunit
VATVETRAADLAAFAAAHPAADIIVLDEGKVVQSGTHERLISEPGYYQDIYNQQLEEKLSGQDG